MSGSANLPARSTGRVRPLRAALMYGVAASTWILSTGWLMERLSREIELGDSAEVAKGLFFVADDLPAVLRDSAALRDRVLLRLIGSPDPYGMQIDGLGGATSSPSKVVLVLSIIPI